MVVGDIRYRSRNTVLKRRRLWKPAGGDAPYRHLSEPGNRVDHRASRRQLGPAPQARTEPGELGSGGGGEEAAIPVAGGAGGAHRPAVDAGGDDGDEKQAVETRVAGADGAGADDGIQ
jgi:hypothetical protein